MVENVKNFWKVDEQKRLDKLGQIWVKKSSQTEQRRFFFTFFLFIRVFSTYNSAYSKKSMIVKTKPKYV